MIISFSFTDVWIAKYCVTPPTPSELLQASIPGSVITKIDAIKTANMESNCFGLDVAYDGNTKYYGICNYADASGDHQQKRFEGALTLTSGEKAAFVA